MKILRYSLKRLRRIIGLHNLKNDYSLKRLHNLLYSKHIMDIETNYVYRNILWI